MKILIFENKEDKTIIDELKETDSIEEVAKILRPYRNRIVFLEIINTLLNELSDLEIEYKRLAKKSEEERKIEVL